MRSNLWLLPGLGAGTAVLLAKVLPWLEARLPLADSAWYLFPGQAGSARELLSTIASSMMTFTGLVFSVTILVLQLASSQFSPRVLRTFLSDSSTRRAMALFIGTFVYAMALLPEVRGADAVGGERVPALSVFLAFALVLVSVAVFIQYIHGMAHSIRAVHVVHRVADDASEGIGELDPEPAELDEAPLELPKTSPDQRIGNGGRGGVLTAVDDAGLLRLAREANVAIEIVPMPGAFVVRGGELARVWGGTLASQRVREHLVIAEERTSHQELRELCAPSRRAVLNEQLQALDDAVAASSRGR